MTLGSRGQLHVSRPTCLFTCFKMSSSKFYNTLHIFRAYILCKAYDVQSPWKYFPNTYTRIRYLLRMVLFKKDVIAVSYNNKCVIYLTVGDCCRVFPLHRMYELVDTAVVIWCWTSVILKLYGAKLFRGSKFSLTAVFVETREFAV